MEDTRADWQVAGRQLFRIESDTVYWEVCGDVLAVELARIFGAALEVQEVHGYALLFIASEGQWSFPPESRQFLAQFHKQHKAVGATAVVGISPTMRLFVDLVMRAIGLVSGHRPTLRFFRTRAEAQAWLTEQRARGQQGLLQH